MIEYIDVVDENNNLTGRVEERDIIHKEGLWHREVAIWIYNDNREVLLQKRAATKKQAPNKWSMCEGHIDSGEVPDNTALRELEEELGVKVNLNKIKLICIEKKEANFGNSKNNNFQYIYFLECNKKIEDYTIQKEELSEVKYIAIEELEDIVDRKDEDYTFSKRLYMSRIIEEIKKRM